MRVLVVEDEPKMAELIGRGLREAGLVVDLAGRGEDALWMATASRYDAILLDVMLPGIDGFETCRRLRDEEVLIRRRGGGGKGKGKDDDWDKHGPKA